MFVLALVGTLSMLWQVYSWTWKPMPIAGHYDLREPGEFADARAGQHTVEQLDDPREFRYTPPAPDRPALLRFTHTFGGRVYVDGKAMGTFSADHGRGCRTLRVLKRNLTATGCPL